MKDKIQEIINESMPVFKTILSDKDWNKVIKNYLKRVNAIPSSCNDVIKSSCLIDLIICSRGESEIAKANKETIKGISIEINKAVAYCDKRPSLLKKVKDTIRKSITEMDIDIATRNSAFKNWVNELYVFNLLAAWDDYEIVDLERPFGNGKTCDFVCRNSKGEEIWFEVKTIQGIDPSKQDDSITMNEFINERIMYEFKEKIGGILPKNMPNIRILPVVEYVDGLEKFDILLNSDIATEPFAVMKNNIDGVVQTELRPLNIFLSQIRAQQDKK
jgi:hypothetical protein